MKVLHLVGSREDDGGVLSVIRNLQTSNVAGVNSPVVWVSQVYQETRRPALEYRYSRHICSDSPSHMRILFGALKACGELRTLMAQEQFDLLHAHSRGTLLVVLWAARQRGWPAVFTNHNFARRTGLYRWAAGQKNIYTVMLTPNMARHYSLKENPPKTSVISACCAGRFFDEPLAEREAGAGERRPWRLIGLGNVVGWKNWHLLAQAICQLSEDDRKRLEIWHFGPTPRDAQAQAYAAELHKMIEANGLGNRFIFHGPTGSVSEQMRKADVFVLPSTNEPCSVALIEALAIGLPAVVSASGGNVDIVQAGKSGLLFEPESSADLALKLRSIINGEASFLGPDQIRQTVRCRSASDVASRYAALYEQIASIEADRQQSKPRLN